MRPLRAFIYLLVLLNIGTYYWYRHYADSPAQYEPPVASAPPEGVRSLRLLSETAEKQAPTASAQVTVDTAPPPRKEPALQTTPPAPPAPEQLTVDITPASPSQTSQQCLRGGPFKTAQERMKVRQWLTSLSTAEITENDETSQGKTTYWVGLGRTERLSDANKILDELQQAGIKDIAVIPLKAGGYLVSLGLYRFQDIALKRRQQIRALGFDARIHPRTRQRTLYWLGIRTRDAERLQQILAKGRSPLASGVRFTPVPCPE